MTSRPKWEELREAFERYARGRAELLEAIGVRDSNRDPFAEFSEQPGRRRFIRSDSR